MGDQVCAPDEGGGGRESDSYVCRRDVVVGVELRGFCRGYATTWRDPRHQRGSGGREYGGDDTPSRQWKGPSLQAVVNEQISVAQTVDVVLKLVDEHGGEFDFINVSTSINMLAKLARLPAKRAESSARVGVMLSGKFSRLI